MAISTDLAEHATTLTIVIGGLSVIVQGLIAVIFLDMKNDLREIKKSMTTFTVEIFERLRKAELSIETLWTEHRLTKSSCADCHFHTRESDHHPASKLP